MREIEVIDLKPRDELERTWRPFIHSHHWGAYSSLEDSYLFARWPRRSCEGLWNAKMQNDPNPDNRMPIDGDWSEIESFVRQLAAQVRISDHREHPDRTIVNSNIGAS